MSKAARETHGSTKGQMLKAGITAAVVFGALGGMMPTLLRIAASLSGDANAALTELAGAALGTTIYGIVGATLAIVLGKTSTYDAFVTGIAAPAIVASMIHGATDIGDGRDRYSVGRQIRNQFRLIAKSRRRNRLDLLAHVGEIAQQREILRGMAAPREFLRDGRGGHIRRG